MGMHQGSVLSPFLFAVVVDVVTELARQSALSKLMYANCPDASVTHTSGSGQLQANPHVAGPWLSTGKPTRMAVTTMGSNTWS